MASILGIPIEDVPVLGDDWAEQLREWIVGIGRKIVYVFGNRKPLETQRDPPRGYSIVSQRVLVTGGIHAVVCLDGKIVHDPSRRPFSHPSYPVELWTVIGEKQC